MLWKPLRNGIDSHATNLALNYQARDVPNFEGRLEKGGIG
jgi:hypothetical protein